MNALERTFINKTIKVAVNTLENENFGFKRIHFTRYEQGCAVELAKYNKELDKMQSIMIYAEENGIVTRVEYRAERI